MTQLEMFEVGQASSNRDWVLSELRHEWKESISGPGGHCPCCNRWGKVYKYKLSQHLALCLKWIVAHADEEGWTDVQNTAPRWMMKSKTYPLLANWRLIESGGARSGLWRATELGKEFVLGRRSMPSAVYMYDNQIWGFDEEEIFFRSCFGRHFDFDALMSDQFQWANLGALHEPR